MSSDLFCYPLLELWDFLLGCLLLKCPLYYQGHQGCFRFASGRYACASLRFTEGFLAPVLMPPVLAIAPPYKSPWRGDLTSAIRVELTIYRREIYTTNRACQFRRDAASIECCPQVHNESLAKSAAEHRVVGTAPHFVTT